MLEDNGNGPGFLCGRVRGMHNKILLMRTDSRLCSHIEAHVKLASGTAYSGKFSRFMTS